MNLKTLLLAAFATIGTAMSCDAADRPNILWITSEDNGPHLGCYGDDYAVTPHLDALSKKKPALHPRQFDRAGMCASSDDGHQWHFTRPQPGPSTCAR